jgi:glucokinase
MAGVLAGDIGGTKTRLALVVVDGTQANVSREREFRSADYATFDDLLSDRDVVHSAAFGVAGPVHNDTVQTANVGARLKLPSPAR